MDELIQQTLDHLLPEGQDPLSSAARHSTFGGKRLRPRLCLFVLLLYGVDLSCGLYPAAALELLHTYSLIHDDLPCMDDDDLRRGRPTLHKLYDESTAILTGDFLLTYAFEILAKAPKLSEAKRLSLVHTLAIAGGATGLIGGQLLDLSENNQGWESMATKKTGALFSASLMFGAIIAEQDPAFFKKLGEHLGLAYQLQDDLDDEDGALHLFGHELLMEKLEAEMIKVEEMLSELPEKGGALKVFIDGVFSHLASKGAY